MKIEKVNENCFCIEDSGCTFFFSTLEKAELAAYRIEKMSISAGFYSDVIIDNKTDKIIANRQFSTTKDFVAKFFELNSQNG